MLYWFWKRHTELRQLSFLIKVQYWLLVNTFVSYIWSGVNCFLYQLDSLESLLDLVRRCETAESGREVWVADSGVSGYSVIHYTVCIPVQWVARRVCSNLTPSPQSSVRRRAYFWLAPTLGSCWKQLNIFKVCTVIFILKILYFLTPSTGGARACPSVGSGQKKAALAS